MRFAELDDNNVVTRVIVADSLEWVEETLGGVWLETFKDGTRGHMAGIGYSYDSELDAFIPAQPYPSWVLDEETLLWSAPVPIPDTENSYVWDEDAGDWVAAEASEV